MTRVLIPADLRRPPDVRWAHRRRAHLGFTVLMCAMWFLTGVMAGLAWATYR